MRKLKQILSLSLIVALLTTCMPMATFATTTSTIPEKVSGAYQLKTAEDLYWFAGLVNGTLENVEQEASANAVLCNDITVNVDVLDDEGGLNDGEFEPWVPIGTKSSPYTGSFDGNGHTISNIKIKSNAFFINFTKLFLVKI